jgi:hypothetical protein
MKLMVSFALLEACFARSLPNQSEHITAIADARPSDTHA